MLHRDESERAVAIAAYERELTLQRFDVARREAEARLQRLEAYVGQMQPVLRRYRDTIAEMRASPFWRLRRLTLGVLGTLRGRRAAGPDSVELSAADGFGAAREVRQYEGWLRDNALRPWDIERLRGLAGILRATPTLSIITPVYETPEAYLRAMIESVLGQVYPHWELCLANDASPSPYVRAVLDEYAALDPRIKVIHRPENGHISRASNSALAAAGGEFVALLDHDDLLAPDALFEVAATVNRDPGVDIMYSDEDKIDDDGRRLDPYFKPDWSPESFLSRMYTGHLAVFRRSLLEEIGGFRPEFDGSQDYDLVLRATEKTERIHHIPRVLYHWRVHSGSVASAADAKMYAYDSALRAIREALERRGEPGVVEMLPNDLGRYRVRYTIRRPERVSIIIPTRDHAVDIERCLHSIFEKSTYRDFEIVILDNGSTEKTAIQTLDAWKTARPEQVHVVRYDVPFNYSQINNYAAERSTGPYLLFLNNDTEVIAPDWIEAMLEQAQRPAIGAVGARLLYEDNTIQHAGVVLRIGGVAGHSHRFMQADIPGYYHAVKTIGNFSAVTGACMMIRREVFNQVHGFDERLAVAFNDVDLCLRIRAAGYRIVYVPDALLYHFESKTRGSDDTAEKRQQTKSEEAFMQHRWNIGQLEDPFYSPHLTLRTEDYAIRS